VIPSIDELPASVWDSCANPQGAEYNPFISHAFFLALEKSGSVTVRRGWQPSHIVVEDSDKQVVGVTPAYVKVHSQGEYVFDHPWVHALHRAGFHYYPKLQVAVPFTPVTGARLLVRSGSDSNRQRVARQLLQACMAIANHPQRPLSSAHITFMPEQQWHLAAGCGWLQRTDCQFHWKNQGYGNFEDFLVNLSSKKRKNFRRERREALAADITIEWLSGTDIKEWHWDAFFKFYMETGSRKWGSPYLTRSFFSMVGESMAADILLVLCRRNGRFIAGALHFIGSQALYGRNWGCIEHHRFLHFEACYYQAIDFAIARGLQRVEAGAQGMHKLIRGYEPRPTFSAHWFVNADINRALSGYLEQERSDMEEYAERLSAHVPFKAGSKNVE